MTHWARTARVRLAVVRVLAVRVLAMGVLGTAVVVGLLATLGACDRDSGPTGTAGTTTPARPTDREALASLAAAAKDRRYVATYALDTPGRPTREVTVALATDGSWVVAIPAAALDGRADVAIFHDATGLYSCVLGPVPLVSPACVPVENLTGANDPLVQHVFTDWIDPLLDRAVALAVTSVAPPSGVRGTCFAVDSSSAALPPPLDPGTYCFDADGQLTAARLGLGNLTLVGAAGPAPSRVAMPAPTTPPPLTPPLRPRRS